MPLKQKSRQMYRQALDFKRTARWCRETGRTQNARILERAAEAAYERARDRAQLERDARWAERNQAILEKFGLRVLKGGV